MIASWWAELSPVMKILWGVTLTASLIFIIQTILTFVGADADGGMDMDIDVDTDPRNFVNFFLGFGWTAILLQGHILSPALLILVAVVVGVALVALVMYLFKWLSSMQQAGNINVYKSAVGCQGKAYLPIPAARSGEGKVQITINNAVREYNAVTDGDAIRTGAQIKVTEVLDAETLLVEELNSLII